MSSHTSNSDDHELESRRIKRRRISFEDPQSSSSSSSAAANSLDEIRWTSPSEQHTYSSKLLAALRHVRHTSTSSSSSGGSRAVRDAADKALAISARGRTRWSRALLSNRMKLRLKHHKKAKIRPPPPPPVTRRRVAGEMKNPPAPAMERRVKTLGRLVPGCRKLPFQNLLEEATDYIAALQMQVRAMAALADILATGSTGENLSSSSNTSPVGPGTMS